MKKNRIIMLSILSIVATIMVACSKDFSFPEYTISNSTKTEDIGLDEGVTLDGVLNESFWTDVEGNETTVVSDFSENVMQKTKTYITEKGVYFGITVLDNAIYYNPERSSARNTSAEIYLAPIGSNDYYNIRIVPNGEGNGLADGDITWKYNIYDNTWHRWVLDWHGAAQIQGEMNSSDCQGYTAEIFVSWETLGAEPADYIRYMPAFNHVQSTSVLDGERTWTGYTGCDTRNPASYIAVSNDAYGTVEDIIDATIECDAHMKIDGVLDEEEWKELKPFNYEYSLGNNKKLNVSTKYYGSDSGAYLGITMKDPYIFSSDLSVRPIGLNSGLELYIAASDTEEIDYHTLQLRITADNCIDRYVGITAVEYPWMKDYFKMISATTIQGNLNASDVSGNEGYTIELFIPWVSLGVSEKQDSILVYPAAVHAENEDNTVKKAPYYNYCNIAGFRIDRAHNPQEKYVELTEAGPIAKVIVADAIVVGDSSLRNGYYYQKFNVNAMAISPGANVTVDKIPVAAKLTLPEGITYGVSDTNEMSIRIPKALNKKLSAGLQYQASYGECKAESTISYSAIEIDGILDGVYPKNPLTIKHPDQMNRPVNDAYFYVGDDAIYIYQMVSDSTARTNNTRTEWVITFGGKVSVENTFSFRLYYNPTAHKNCVNGVCAYNYNSKDAVFPLTENKTLAGMVKLCVKNQNNDTYIMETVIPYKALGLSGKPNSIQVAAMTFNGENKTNTIFNNGNIPDISKYVEIYK